MTDTTTAGTAADSATMAAAAVPASATPPAPTIPRSNIAVLTEMLGDAMEIGVTTLSLCATVPDAGGGKPAYVSLSLSYAGPPTAGAKVGSTADVLTTLSTALADDAQLTETMTVENNYTCLVAVTRG